MWEQVLTFTIILALPAAYFIVKKAIKNGLYDGYDAIKWDLAEKDTQEGFKQIAKNVIRAGAQGAIGQVMPKIKLESVLALGAMKYLGLGDLGSLMGNQKKEAVPEIIAPQDTNKRTAI